MIRKITVPTFLALLALMLLACSPTVETNETSETVETVSQAEPEAAVVEVEVEEEVEVEVKVKEEEEAYEDEEMDDDHSDADDADMEEMTEEMTEEESAEIESTEAVYLVSAADSTVTWTGAKAVGSSHTGGVSITEGSLNIADGQLASGTFVLDMTSLTSADSGGTRLIGHLKSEDFFGVDAHPTAMIAINSADLIDGDQYTVQADLTIKGITNPIEFIATATENNGQLTASADIVFDRAQFDVQYGSGTFFSGLGNDLINDEVEITVSLIANK